MTLAPPQAPLIFKLIAHDIRWHILQLVTESDYRVQELVAILQRPQNLVSYHLGLLKKGHLVHERRSSADGRDVYYTANLSRLTADYWESGGALHPGLMNKPAPVTTKRPFHVLFLCTHNAARSQLAEGILRTIGPNNMRVYSAGTQPTAVHPLAIRVATELNIQIEQQAAKHLEQFLGYPFDKVITVCDKAREICPTFPGEAQHLHWSVPDPTAVSGSETDQIAAFRHTAHELFQRITYLLHKMETQQT